MLRLRKQSQVDLKRNTGHYDPTTRLWIDGSGGALVSIECSLQPLTGKDLKKLPEGYSSPDIKKLFTDVELFTDKEDTNTESDYLVIDGSTYKVMVVEYWRELRLSHYEVLAGKVEKA